MAGLILELYAGKEALRRRDIIEGCHAEHKRRGGAETGQETLRSAFKKASNDLRLIGALEDAGVGYWHVPGWHGSEDWRNAISAVRPRRTNRRIAKRQYEKHILYGQQEGRCADCGRHYRRPEDLTVDHKQPLSKGGADVFSNLQLLCFSCNSAKGDR